MNNDLKQVALPNMLIPTVREEEEDPKHHQEDDERSLPVPTART